MRRLIPLLALLLMALLAACGGGAPAPAPTTPATSAPTTSAPTTAPQLPAGANTPAAPVATPDIEKILNPQPEDWSRGPKDAKVTIIEWADFQCPYCSAVAPLFKRLAEAYPNDVRTIYRHFPLPSHDKSLIAAEATEAAGAQGKFWEMNEMLFATQNDWAGQSADEFRKTLSQDAQKIGLDVKKFEDDLTQGKYTDKVTAARNLAEQISVPGTPFLLVNKQPWPQDQLPLAYNNLVGMVKLFVDLPQKELKQAPAMKIDKTKTYLATITTDLGDIAIKLYADKAPIAVNNFVFLARQGWYDNVTFHRVISGFVAQAGDPTGLGFGGPGYTFGNEVTGLKFDKAGLLAMANSGAGQDGKGTNGSQFFITLAPTPDLDAADPAKEANYTIFGEVVSGLDVANKLVIRDPQSSPEVDGSVIKTITIEEK